MTKTKEQKAYDEFIAGAAAALKPDEFWCIKHPDGLLEETKSKDLGHPVRVVCDSLNADWDDLREQGYELVRIQVPPAKGEPAIVVNP